MRPQILQISSSGEGPILTPPQNSSKKLGSESNLPSFADARFGSFDTLARRPSSTGLRRIPNPPNASLHILSSEAGPALMPTQKLITALI